MAPDEFQQAWQAQSSQTRVTIDANLLRQVVEHDQLNFRATIFYRDFVEVGVALLLIPIWFLLGAVTDSPWTWYLTVPVLVWSAGFMLVYRMRHKQKPSEPGEPLLPCVKRLLTEVEDQIWLLRNIFWWYLLPPSISLMAFNVHVSWLAASVWWEFLGTAALFGFVLFVIYASIYYLNQRAVRVDLEPRRQELLTLLSSLGDETTGEGTGNQIPLPGLPFAKKELQVPCNSPVRITIGLFTIVVILVFLVIFIAWMADGGFDSSNDRPDAPANLVAELRQENQLVGLAAMVMVDGKVVAAVADGERKVGSGVTLETSDSWHLGGISKSITATMIARLVESGQMQWTDTIGESFPNASLHEDWKSVTLRQLLTDTAGAPALIPRDMLSKRPARGPERTRARREAVLDFIAVKPENPPGKKRVYSNVGYTIAGAMAEKMTGITWEDLVKREVAVPLKLRSVGFGPPKSAAATLEQPRGHRLLIQSKIAASDERDNTPIIGPAGTVHMTLYDLCTFAREHMLGERGEGKLLTAETYKLLHTPDLDNYACGWIKKEPSEEIPYTVYWHNGSNTLWYALVVFIPEKNMVVAVTSNDGDSKKAEAAAWEIVDASVKQSNIIALSQLSDEFPKKAPFAAVGWQESQPEVKLGEEWFKLVLLDGLPASEIVAFSKQTYGDKWQKRFEEDLVELLTRMGHPPQDKVTLDVQSLYSFERQVRKDVPMTKENRSAIRKAAQKRETSEP
ncbi:serine hydrolase domain-containing protein [uncultured Gimesia sp.]|uniref:serine hydrolase domain-containing protein n=1 Tax=uncultured Gimesia sp. TaxID=1678688 RepID=UPI0030DB82A1|tara:strand:+ start:6174 stop:8384 length:2211 start_codon:yes stop_codon:yes gene_type:complete